MKLFLLQILNELIFYIYILFTILGMIITLPIMPFICIKDKIDSLYINKCLEIKKTSTKNYSFFLLWGAKNILDLISFPFMVISFILGHICIPFIDFQEIIEWCCSFENQRKWEEKQKEDKSE